MVVREVMLEGKLTRVKQEKKSIHLHFIWSPCISSSLEHFLWRLIGHPCQKKEKENKNNATSFLLSHSPLFLWAQMTTVDFTRALPSVREIYQG